MTGVANLGRRRSRIRPFQHYWSIQIADALKLAGDMKCILQCIRVGFSC
jgi:hypothetical protein